MKYWNTRLKWNYLLGTPFQYDFNMPSSSHIPFSHHSIVPTFHYSNYPPSDVNIQLQNRVYHGGGALKPAHVYFDSMEVNLDVGPDIHDVTDMLAYLVQKSKIENGVLCANAVGSTGSITTIEFEPGVVKDLKDAIDRLAPPGMPYAHEKAWHDGNGHSHVQAALLGPSITIGVRNGRLRLGTWQQVVVINHDNHARSRSIEITITGA